METQTSHLTYASAAHPVPHSSHTELTCKEALGTDWYHSGIEVITASGNGVEESTV